jgi:hypothetical protein
MEGRRGHGEGEHAHATQVVHEQWRAEEGTVRVNMHMLRRWCTSNGGQKRAR